MPEIEVNVTVLSAPSYLAKAEEDTVVSEFLDTEALNWGDEVSDALESVYNGDLSSSNFVILDNSGRTLTDDDKNGTVGELASHLGVTVLTLRIVPK